jgi:sulfate adenylyltransferase subunit 1
VICVLPSGIQTRIKSIEQNGHQRSEANKGESIILHFEDDVDVSRGDLVVGAGPAPIVSQEQEVLVCWMGEKPLAVDSRYLLQLQSRKVVAVVKEVVHKVNVLTLEPEIAEQAFLNDIVRLRLKTSSPIAYDTYETLRVNGGFILIDETSCVTVGAGLFL